MSLPVRHEVQALVRIHPVSDRFAHSFVPGPGYGLVGPVLSSRARARRRNHQVPRVPLPDVGVTFIREPCSRLLRGHYSPFFAPTDSFANPMRLSSTSVVSIGGGFCPGGYQPLRPPGPSRRYFCESVLRCLSPYPGGPTECICLVLPQRHRPSPKGDRVGFPLVSANTIFRGGVSRLQLFRYVQASQFACLPDRSYRCKSPHRAAETFTSEQNVRRYLRTHRICYPPDHRQLAERGLAPRKIRSFVGCSHPCLPCC